VARYLLESSAIDGYLLEDGTGVLLLETNQEFLTLSSTHTGTSAHPVLAVNIIRACSHVATASVKKFVTQTTRAMSHVGTASLLRAYRTTKLLTYNHVGTATLALATKFVKLLSYAATHTASIITQFLPAPAILAKRLVNRLLIFNTTIHHILRTR